MQTESPSLIDSGAYGQVIDLRRGLRRPVGGEKFAHTNGILAVMLWEVIIRRRGRHSLYTTVIRLEYHIKGCSKLISQ